jgi:hypothetical protein
VTDERLEWALSCADESATIEPRYQDGRDKALVILATALREKEQELYELRMTCLVCKQYGDGCSCGGVDGLLKQLREAREALAFYADADNWTQPTSWGGRIFDDEAPAIDSGKRARVALREGADTDG